MTVMLWEMRCKTVIIWEMRCWTVMMWEMRCKTVMIWEMRCMTDDSGDEVSDRDDVGDAVPLQTKDIRGSIHIPYEKARLHLKKEKEKGSAFYVWFSPQKLDWFYVEDKVSTNNTNNCLVCFYYQSKPQKDRIGQRRRMIELVSE